MLTSKDRAYLRGLANKLSPVFQVGKMGISEEMCKGISDYLEANELMKIHILQNCDYTSREVAEIIAEATNSDVVCVIGSKVVLYRESKNEKNRKILL